MGCVRPGAGGTGPGGQAGSDAGPTPRERGAYGIRTASGRRAYAIRLPPANHSYDMWTIAQSGRVILIVEWDGSPGR